MSVQIATDRFLKKAKHNEPDPQSDRLMQNQPSCRAIDDIFPTGLGHGQEVAFLALELYSRSISQLLGG